VNENVMDKRVYIFEFARLSLTLMLCAINNAMQVVIANLSVLSS